MSSVFAILTRNLLVSVTIFLCAAIGVLFVVSFAFTHWTAPVCALNLDEQIFIQSLSVPFGLPSPLREFLLWISIAILAFLVALVVFFFKAISHYFARENEKADRRLARCVRTMIVRSPPYCLIAITLSVLESYSVTNEITTFLDVDVENITSLWKMLLWINTFFILLFFIGSLMYSFYTMTYQIFQKGDIKSEWGAIRYENRKASQKAFGRVGWAIAILLIPESHPAMRRR